MRYLLALVCPPLALLACHRPWPAVAAGFLFVAGIATAGWGVGVLMVFGSIFWAMNAVGDERAARVTSEFIRTVRPIRMFRR